jgi:hypothetical protein
LNLTAFDPEIPQETEYSTAMDIVFRLGSRDLKTEGKEHK